MIVIGTTVSTVLSFVGVGLLGAVVIRWIGDTRRDIDALLESSRTDLYNGKHTDPVSGKGPVEGQLVQRVSYYGRP